MLGLFKKKEKIRKTEEEETEYLILVDKWDAYLRKIDTRFKESLSQAEEALLGNLVEGDYDVLPTMRAWQGIKSQLMGISDTIEATFNDKVKPEMRKYKEEYDLIDEEYKGTYLGESFYSKLERYEIELEGKLAQKFYDHALNFLNEDFNCSQCAAKLEVKKDIFRSHYVSCDYCNTVNTFTPHSKIYEIRHFAVDNISKYNALKEWDNMQSVIREFNEIPSPSEDEDKTEYINGFKQREIAERAYWNRFLNERIKLMSEYKDSLEHDLEVKMQFFYEERKARLNF